MAQFLRDQQIRNRSITVDRLDELFAIFDRFGSRLTNAGVPHVVMSCIIRFDEKGYRVFTIGDLRTLYRQARDVERVVFSIDTIESIRTARQFGEFMELTLDNRTAFGYLVVSADDQGWVEAGFSAVSEVVAKGRAWFGPLRTAWTELTIQIAGVALTFLLSLAAARELSPRVSVENPFLISFMFFFLLGANIWGYLQRQLHMVIGRIFPNVEFVREGRERLHWLPQSVITAFVSVVVVYLFTETANALFGAATTFIRTTR